MTSTFAECPHERRPGTTVCLHCRHEQREQARRRRRHFVSRASVVVLALGTLAIASVSVATALQSKFGRTAERLTIGSPAAEPAAAEPAATNPAADTSASELTVSLAASSARDLPALTPLIPEGRSDFSDGMFALREGANLSVNFDTPLTRTRRRDKFEHIVRMTLPKLFGAPADSMLAHLPEGAMASGDLVSELTQRGIRLPAVDGWTIAIWPLTRPGQDGPLVVSYRVVVQR